MNPVLNVIPTFIPDHSQLFVFVLGEILEETGMDVEDIKMVTVINVVMKEWNRHSVTIFMKCFPKTTSPKPQVCIL